MFVTVPECLQEINMVLYVNEKENYYKNNSRIQEHLKIFKLFSKLQNSNCSKQEEIRKIYYVMFTKRKV